MKNQFTEKYETVGLLQLVDVIVNPQNYNEEAIQAAEEELKRREINGSELEEAKDLIYSANGAVRVEKGKLQKWKNAIIYLFDPSREKSPESSFKLLCWSLILLFTYKVGSSYDLIIFNLKYPDFSNPVFYAQLFTIVLNVSIIVLVLKKTKTGYYMLYVSLIINILLMLLGIVANRMISDAKGQFIPITSYFINIIIYSCLLWFINTKNLKFAFFNKLPRDEEIEKMINEIKTD